MKRTILAAAVLSLGFSAPVFAQSNVHGSMPPEWKGPIEEVFFADSAAGTLRTQDEINTRWSTLTPEQQAQVKTDCQQTAQVHGSGPQTGASGTDGGGNADPNTTASTNATGSEEQIAASMNQLCGWVGSM